MLEEVEEVDETLVDREWTLQTNKTIHLFEQILSKLQETSLKHLKTAL